MMKDQYTLENRVARRLLPDNGYLMLDSSTPISINFDVPPLSGCRSSGVCLHGGEQ